MSLLLLVCSVGVKTALEKHMVIVPYSVKLLIPGPLLIRQHTNFLWLSSSRARSTSAADRTIVQESESHIGLHGKLMWVCLAILPMDSWVFLVLLQEIISYIQVSIYR